MIKFLVVILLFMGAVFFASAPWLSALVYSIVSLLQPHYIWFWAFDGIPVFNISAGIAIIAFCFQAVRGQVYWSVYATGQFKGMLALLCLFYLSSWFTPFQNYISNVSGDLVVDIFTSIFIMYFVVLGVIRSPTTIKYFAFMFIFVTLYYAYWANDQYVSGNWHQFVFGRLNGPPNSPYRDGNVLSVLITTGLSFVMFGIRFIERKWIKIGSMLFIPFVWHSLILFASRGALISAIAVTLFFAFVVKSKKLNYLMVLGFVAMLAWQGSEMTSRATSTVAQAQQSEGDRPLNPRLVSWQIGWNLALKYPILGVGPQRFQSASRLHYPEKAKHVAHNTFLNFSANTGLISGIIYLLFFYISYKQYCYVRARAEQGSVYEFVNLSCGGGLIAFFVGAVFLDLIIFEPFYFVLMLMSANYCQFRREQEPSTSEKNIEMVVNGVAPKQLHPS